MVNVGGEMKLTNKYGHPQALVRALKPLVEKRQVEGDITVTELIGPPRIKRLREQHWDALVVDITELGWLMLGQGVHMFIAQAQPEYVLGDNVRLSITLPNGMVMSGQPDLWEPVFVDVRALWDWKVMSIWEIINGVDERKVAQLNLYAWMLERHDYPVDTINLECFLRDWKLRDARLKRREGYPQTQIYALTNLTRWQPADMLAYLGARIASHCQEALPECSAEERWQKPDKWALMKGTNKRAVRLYDSEAEAMEHATEENLWVQYRPSEPTRCLDYCPVRGLCEQGQSLLKIYEEQSNGEVA